MNTQEETLEIKSDEEVTGNEQLLRLFMQKLLGHSLDYARMSGMSDRSFEQFKKSLKDVSYSTLEKFVKLMGDLEAQKAE